jgi:hypothetical protein
MINFEIEYTTNLDDRKTVTLRGMSVTDAYLKFVAVSPKHYIITDIKEICNGNV